MYLRLKLKRQRWIRCMCSTVCLLLFVVGFIVWSSEHVEPAREHFEISSHVPSRHLLYAVNCSPPAIDQFPKDLFSKEQRNGGGITIHVLVSLYMFLGLAIVCDDYFVPALERICEVLKLQPDVAGATFMAAGSSAPELATAVIAIFITKDDIGVGTVVGSAVFNIMFVIGICSVLAGVVVYLNWWPLFRDTSWYACSIIALVLVMYDEVVKWWEAMILLIMYALYILFMCFNQHIENWIHSHCEHLKGFRRCYKHLNLEKKELIPSNYELVKTKYGNDQSDSEASLEDLLT